MGYEWFKASGASATLPPGRQSGEPPAALQQPATKEELHGFLMQLEASLDTAEHFRTYEKKAVMWQNIQNIFLRLPLSSQEVRTLRGVLRSLSRNFPTERP
jgi:tRNA/rRNA methyltransferase